MKVCIAEKPSVAREIAQIIGAKTKKNGYFEGNGYQVTWTFGHLCSLLEPHDYDEKWKFWNVQTLPIIPNKYEVKLINNKGVDQQFKVIKNLVDNAAEIINCGDAGQEGELIQRWVLKHANNQKPIKRLWISSLTEEAIKEGFKDLKDGADFDRLYAAGQSRAIGDWLLGMNATRLFTLKFAKEKQVLSIGRVQTPSLALIVNRQYEIENFEPTTYWELKTVYKGVTFNRQAESSDEDNDGKAPKNAFKSIEEGQTALTTIKDLPFEVVNFKTKKGKELPPKLFDLTSLQVECNKRFGLSADDTLKLIQGLYERKLVTYPRVDTTYLPNDIYPKVPSILKGLYGYENLTTPLLGEKIKKSKKVFDDKKVTDHHAIIPTGVKAMLGGNEKQVYDTIARRFISVFYPDCEISNTTVDGKVDTINFKATGKQILKPGWRIVYQNPNKKTEESGVMPTFEKGEQGPHEPDLQEKQTQPPKYYTEATLLRAMETAGKNVDDEDLREAMKENGIGRPSTRAAIIETLFRRRYIRKERKNLIATNVGVALISTIKNDLLKSAELTGQWEYKLRQIEKGDYKAGTFIKEMNQMVDDLVNQVRRIPTYKWIGINVEDLTKKKKSKKNNKAKPTTCPKCNKGRILKGKTAFGCSEYKNGCQFVIKFEQHEKKLTDNQVLDLIGKGKTKLIKGFLIDGKKKDGVLMLDANKSIQFFEEQEEALKCPKCKTGTFVEGKAAFGCENFKKGCKTIIPFENFGKKLSKSQLKQLITKGKTNKLKGLTTTTGEKIDGKIVLNSGFKLEIQE